MRQKHLTFIIVFLVLLCSIIALVAVSQQKSRNQLYAEMVAAKDELYNPDSGAYPLYKSAFDDLEADIKSFIKAHEQLKGIRLSPRLDPLSQLIDGIEKNLKAKYLSDDMKKQLEAIGNKQNNVAFLWLDVERAWDNYYTAVGEYNYGLSPNERIGITKPEQETETPLWFCAGSCDELFTTSSGAQVSHQEYCPEKHGPSGVTGVTYYLCSGSCPRSNEHWLVCGGTCGKKFAPKRISRGQGNYVYVANSPHYVKCDKGVYSVLPGAKCGKEYYTCQHSTCPDSNRHWSAGSSPPPNNGGSGGSGGGGNNQPTDNTPNCSGCTSDCSSPCSCTNSGTCGGTVVDNTPNCNDCTDGCSSCPTVCTSCGRTYDPDSSSDKMMHEAVECIKCGADYHICSSQWGDCSESEPSPGWHHSAE